MRAARTVVLIGMLLAVARIAGETAPLLFMAMSNRFWLLDPISTAKIKVLLNELKRDFTIVIVTHNKQQAARISDSRPTCTWGN